MAEVISIRKKNLVSLGYADLLDWCKDENHVYIGRNMSFYVPGAVKSKWANPFSVKKYGREECLRLYKNYILSRSDLMDNLGELQGKVLGCWCREPNMDPEIPVCHGDILLELLTESD